MALKIARRGILVNRDKLCFVIGPIGAYRSEERTHADKLLSLVIRPTFATHFKSFKVERADEIARPGMIDSQVITHLIEADLVIADLTTRNANAFYELGIRHMLQKPIIHVFLRGDTIPADIAPYRAIEYSYEGKWDIRDAKVALRRTVTEVLQPGFQIENPVTRSAGFVRMQASLGKERGKIAMLAVAAHKPVKQVRDKLSGLVTKTVMVPMPPGSFKPFFDPLEASEKKFNELLVAITGFGANLND